MSLVQEIALAVEELREEEAKSLVEKAISERLDLSMVLRDGISTGMKRLGERFQKGEYFLAELVIGGDLGKQCMDMVTPHLTKALETRGKVLLATVKGDVHNIGKDLVALQLEGSGFEVFNLGVDMPTLEIIKRAREVNPDIIGLSAFLTSTVTYTGEMVRYLVDMGLRDQFKVIIGGSGTSVAYAQSIGADGWAKDCFEAVGLCDNLLASGARR